MSVKSRGGGLGSTSMTMIGGNDDLFTGSFPDTRFPMSRRTVLEGAAAVLASGMAGGAAKAVPPVRKRFDAIVYGATPAGIVAAVRMAREGLTVLLATPYGHVGGMLSNGLSMMDALYVGRRAPLYDEFLDRVRDAYVRRDGADAPSVAMTGFEQPLTWHRRPRFEAHVAEAVFEAMLSGEQRIAVLREYEVTAVAVDRRTIRSVEFASLSGGERWSATTAVVMDCSYEGDLLGRAGVAYALGREGRDDFGEPHAGAFFVSPPSQGPEPGTVGEFARILPIARADVRLLPGSTGLGDKTAQAFNIRFVLSSDPKNRRPIVAPLGYDRAIYAAALETAGIDRLGFTPTPLMNDKAAGPGFGDWIGHSVSWAEASWPERRVIYAGHVRYGLGLIHFLATDPAVPASIRTAMARYGLAGDEFTDVQRRGTRTP
jgi:choline dehydrogenase-like flavoprotein